MATQEHIDEILALIKTGDIKPEEYLDFYYTKYGRSTTLTTTELVEMLANDVDGTTRGDNPELNAVEMRRLEDAKALDAR